MTDPVKNAPKIPMPAKVPVVPMILAVMAGALATLLLSQLKFSVWIESSSTDNPSPPVIDVAPQQTAPTRTVPTPATSPIAALPDGLRVKNQSTNAVRVVLLTQKHGSSKPADPDRVPIHWDFAPQEGTQNGLLLSLPEGDLTLATGDVLVAFALDGSRRYWGPYVVGESTQPVQSSKSTEWQLILK
jgi:hypothetical protein